MTKLGEVCRHGGLRRMCETCDLAERFDAAVADFADACHEIKELRSKLGQIQAELLAFVDADRGSDAESAAYNTLLDLLPEVPK